MAAEVVTDRYVSCPAPRFLTSLAPVLMVSVGFIDLGKWVVAVEGGSLFGNPVLLVLLFNCSAIFCQYLATCIPAVTGKNLAQICFEEYHRPANLLLGFQAEVSRMMSEISTIIGIGHGFNIFFGVDLLTCTVLATIVSISLPVSLKLLGTHINEVQFVCISGFLFFLYSIGILITQPEAPFPVAWTFPRLSLENSHLVMALLGSNVIVHNFYLQSAMVQKQKIGLSSTVGSLLQDQFFAILVAFSGIFLANCVLMNSATSLFENVGGLTIQDVFLLMDQMFNIHIAPVTIFLILLLSSLISAGTWVIGGHTVVNEFLGIVVSFWVHLLCSKMLVAVPVIYYAKKLGAEGLYQLLIFCQVILAVLLPSSVIPLFRVASSKLLLGTSTMSWYLELLALFTFIWMFSSNLVFIAEAVFGNGSWIVNLRSSMTLPFIFLILIACMSLSLTLYLIVTPLRSARNEETLAFQTNKQIFTLQWRNNSTVLDYSEVCGTATAAESAALGSGKMATLDFNIDRAEMGSDSCQNQTSSCLNLRTTSTLSSLDLVMKELLVSTDLDTSEPANKLLECDTVNLGISGETESSQPFANENIRAETVDKHKGVVIVWDQADVSEENMVHVAAEVSEAPKVSMQKNNDFGSGTGSLSRLPGLGRAARRQFAATLDEFWGHLFDFHGQLTQDARANKVDILLGLDRKIISPCRTEASTSEASRKHFQEVERGSDIQASLRDYRLRSQANSPTGGSFHTFQSGYPSRFSSLQEDSFVQSPSTDAIDPVERHFSSLHLPHHSDSRDYQPVTIHGYQMSSYLQDFGVGRFDLSGFSGDQSLSRKSFDFFIPNYTDQMKHVAEMDGHGSLGTSELQTQRFTEINRQVDLASLDSSSLSGMYEYPVISEKKYRSLPNISRLIVSGRSSYFNSINFSQCGQTSTHPSMAKSPIGRTQFTYPSYQAEGASLTFDELSPSTHYKDTLSSQSLLSADTKSLWSRQPHEQLFGISDNDQAHGVLAADMPSLRPGILSYADIEVRLLKSFRDCMLKVLKMDGSEWLFRQNGGADEELIDQLAMKEIFLQETDMNGSNAYFNAHQQLPSDLELSSFQGANIDFDNYEAFLKCGESCMWRASLIVTFGVWCIRRILELSLVESRPELWGKYTYVLNRLQGILEPAFSKPRSPIVACPCLEIPLAYMKDRGCYPSSNSLQRASMPAGTCYTTSGAILDLIKDVEVAISGRKGRSGTAAGDVAFPKGKENLASVLKRYKRRLLNKSSGSNQSGSLRDSSRHSLR